MYQRLGKIKMSFSSKFMEPLVENTYIKTYMNSLYH